MFIKRILLYIYIFITFISLLLFYILRCKYNIKNLDKFLYIDYETKNNNNNYYYLLNIIIFYIYGILFGIKNFHIIIFKIIIYDCLLIYIYFCNIINIKDKKFKLALKSLITTILISIISYYLGTLISNQFYNKFFNLDNKFNVNFTFKKIKS